MSERRISGAAYLTFVDEETQKKHGKTHIKRWKNETPGQTRRANRRVASAFVEACDSMMFSDAFNPDADGRSYEVHYVANAKFSDRRPCFRIDMTWYDLDSVEVAAIRALFNSL